MIFIYLPLLFLTAFILLYIAKELAKKFRTFVHHFFICQFAWYLIFSINLFSIYLLNDIPSDKISVLETLGLSFGVTFFYLFIIWLPIAIINTFIFQYLYKMPVDKEASGDV